MHIPAVNSCLALGLALVLGTRQVHAMEFSVLAPGDPHVVIHGVGDILPGDDEKLHRFVSSMPANVNLVGILLHSNGGNLLEGVRLATTIKSSQLRTAVETTCASACFLMFAAGTVKIDFDGARIGVHSAGMSGVENTVAEATTTRMARMAAQLGVPPGIIGKMVTTPPDQITWLTADDLLSMGVKLESTQEGSYQPGSALKPGGSPTAATPASRPDSSSQPVNSQQQASLPPPDASPSYLQGRQARAEWEEWFSSLSGDFRSGAEWWAEHRTTAMRNHVSCENQQGSNLWTAGCQQARLRLTASDARRRTEADFKTGWNSL